MAKRNRIIVTVLVFTAAVFYLRSSVYLKNLSGEQEIKNTHEMVTGASLAGNTTFLNPGTTNEISMKKNSSDTIPENDFLRIHFDAILADTHNDFIWKVFDKGAVFGEKNSFTQSDLPRFRAGGVDVQVFAVWIPMNKIKKSYSFTVSQIEKLHSFQTEYFRDFEFALTYDDIIRITGENKVCGLIGIEGGTAIENNPDRINEFYEMGVRYIGLTWNNSNLISTSARDQTERGKSGGLTEFGIQVIRRMNETGMMIDVSHLSEEGFWDVIENSDSPVIASHSNSYTVNPHFRNLTDDQIKAIAKSGGYIGINFYDKFLDNNAERNRTVNAFELYPEELKAIDEKYGDDLIKYNEERNRFLEEKNISGGTTVDKVIEHIDYIKNLVGVDYIGIGSDFDGGITPPNELYDASCYPELTKRLVQKGYTAEEIKKILGGNFLRVFRQVCG